MGALTTITAQDASRGFSTLLDRVEQDGEEYTIERDGRVVARIVPATRRTVAGFLTRRAGRLALDDDFAADATSANLLLTGDTADPWHG